MTIHIHALSFVPLLRYLADLISGIRLFIFTVTVRKH